MNILQNLNEKTNILNFKKFEFNLNKSIISFNNAINNLIQVKIED